jgi:hypothetical protein
MLILVLIFSTGFYLESPGQIGGQRSFEFLEVPSSARLAGMGGINVSLADRDVNFLYANPALIGDTLSGVASASYQFYVGDIGHAALTYAGNFKKVGVITMGIQHMNYGSIKGYDPTGLSTGNFSASETSLVVGKTHQIGNYRIGANIKGIFSGLAGYRSTGLAMDIGGIFKHPKQQLTFGLVFRNLGFVIGDFTATAKSKLPFDTQLGTTFKPQHMPVRFSITVYNLTKTDAIYHYPTPDNKEIPVLKRILTHANFATEVLLPKNVNILFGYNYLSHQTLKLDNGGSGAGLTVGFSATVKNYDFVFSRMAYVAGRAAYSFTLSGNINKLFKRL